MNRNDCEAILHLHRSFLPRRRTGRGFLTGVVFLDAALLICAFILTAGPFVLKPGIALDLPASSQAAGIRVDDKVLTITREGLLFFNDEQITLADMETRFREAAATRPGPALILEADRATAQSTVSAIYDAAARAGFRQIFIATRSLSP